MIMTLIFFRKQKIKTNKKFEFPPAEKNNNSDEPYYTTAVNNYIFNSNYLI